jgi:hypothetical protein
MEGAEIATRVPKPGVVHPPGNNLSAPPRCIFLKDQIIRPVRPVSTSVPFLPFLRG